MCLSAGSDTLALVKGSAMEDGAGEAETFVTFAVVAETDFGDRLVLLGANRELGAWRPEHGIALSTSAESFPVWTVTVRLQACSSASLSYKFAVLRADGTCDWEPGPNRDTELSGHSWALACFGKTGLCSTIPRPVDAALEACVAMWDVTCSATRPGDTLAVVGSVEEVGSWDVTRGIVLRTEEASFPQWYGAATLLQGQAPVIWKLAILRADGTVEWECGEDRRMVLPEGGQEERAVLCRVTFGGQLEQQGRALECPTWTGGAELLRELSPERLTRKAHRGRTGHLEDCDAYDDASTALSGGASFCRLNTTDSDECSVDHDGQRLWAAGHKVPKSQGHCEDAFFVGVNSLGVADGVGSMAYFEAYGVNAADYAAQLMELADDALRPGGAAVARYSTDAWAADALAIAEKNATTFGAATATVLAMAGRTVGVANIGDSGFMLVRGAEDCLAGGSGKGLEIIMRSVEQQHGFNWPYQLMQLPESLLAFAEASQQQHGGGWDTAADCERYEFRVEPRDLILLYTDGFSDNLYEEDILEVIRGVLANGAADTSLASPKDGAGLPNPERLAFALALAARRRSRDPAARVPFNDSAQRHGLQVGGGKPDDITVVAAWVLPDGEDAVSQR